MSGATRLGTTRHWCSSAWFTALLLCNGCHCAGSTLLLDAASRADAGDREGGTHPRDAAADARADTDDAALLMDAALPDAPLDVARFDAGTEDGGPDAADASSDDDSGVAVVPPLHGLACGSNHCCAIDNAQALLCWGKNDQGQTTAPPGRFTAVAAGNLHTCALDTSQRVHCFGRAGLPAIAAPPGAFTAIAVSGNHSCALDTNGVTQCWGDSTSGPLQPPTVILRSMDASARGWCGVDVNAQVLCWGAGTQSWDVPDGQALGVALWNAIGCALMADGDIDCFGDTFESPWGTLPAGPFASVAIGGYHLCAIDAVGALRCFGEGTSTTAGGSDCGDGPEHHCGQANPPDGAYVEVAAGYLHTCAVRADGDVVCFGANHYGQLDVPPSASR